MQCRHSVAHRSYKECKEKVGIHTLDTNVDVILLITGFYLSTVVIGLRERIEGLEILDVRGHEIDWERSAGC